VVKIFFKSSYLWNNVDIGLVGSKCTWVASAFGASTSPFNKQETVDMRILAFNSVLLALALSACAESDPPVREFETVTRQSASQLGAHSRVVPLPMRKSYAVAAELATTDYTPYLARVPGFGLAPQ
jgi:hypothetical protein